MCIFDGEPYMLLDDTIDMSITYSAILLLLVAFLIGSIPTGYLIARSKGIDLRTKGSGNTGATNAARSLGKKLGLLTLVLDALKGVIAVLLASAYPVLSQKPAAFSYIAPLLGTAAVIGHCYSPFLKCRGGKGVATSLGVFLFLTPIPMLIAFIGFVGLIKIKNYVSLASIAATITLVVCIFLGIPSGYSMATRLASVCCAALITIRHGGNIRQLMNGTEPVFNDPV